MKYKLAPGEMVEADKNYRGESSARSPDCVFNSSDARAKDVAAARHETVNRRFKQWRCLKQTFRHNRRKHKYVFGAVVVITQLCIEHGERQFQCRY